MVHVKMVMQRRSFITSLFLGTAGLHMVTILSSAIKQKTLGVQLWNIREYFKKDLTGSLWKLAKLGHNQIEVYGYDGTYWEKVRRSLVKDVPTWV